MLLHYTMKNRKLTKKKDGEIIMVRGFASSSSPVHSFSFSPVHSALI